MKRVGTRSLELVGIGYVTGRRKVASSAVEIDLDDEIDALGFDGSLIALHSWKLLRKECIPRLKDVDFMSILSPQLNSNCNFRNEFNS